MDESALVKVLPHLPTEIKLEILKQCFVFNKDNTLHSDHFPKIKATRVDRFLNSKIPDFAILVGQALYGGGTRVILQPRSIPKKYTGGDNFIIYPKPPVNEWIRLLEFRPRILSIHDHSPPGTKPSESSKDVQLRWIQRLSDGELGFQNLDVLRIVLLEHNFYCASDDEEVLQFELFELGPVSSAIEFVVGIQRLAEFNKKTKGVLRFRAKKLEIVAMGHQGDCAAGPLRCTPCWLYTRLSRVMVAHQDPI